MRWFTTSSSVRPSNQITGFMLAAIQAARRFATFGLSVLKPIFTSAMHGAVVITFELVYIKSLAHVYEL